MFKYWLEWDQMTAAYGSVPYQRQAISQGYVLAKNS